MCLVWLEFSSFSVGSSVIPAEWLNYTSITAPKREKTKRKKNGISKVRTKNDEKVFAQTKNSIELIMECCRSNAKAENFQLKARPTNEGPLQFVLRDGKSAFSF